MDNSFQSYLLYLELMIFFSGYPLLYALVSSLSGNGRIVKSGLNLDTMLVKTYAVTGALYLGLQIRKSYYSNSIQDLTHPSLLIVFALLSILCWLPFLQKRKIAALLHSLFFFIWLLRSFFLELSSDSPDQHVLSNNMKVYTTSFLLNTVVFLIIWILYYIARRYSGKNTR